MNSTQRRELKKTLAFELWKKEDSDVLEFWDKLARARMRTPFFLAISRALIEGNIAEAAPKIDALIMLAEELANGEE